jgi:16S rRNA C967 or C1407 C5-methylase (RsmB/RsmF family)/NOL1/NOP2/fmu family ribosome biogenesis protein
MSYPESFITYIKAILGGEAAVFFESLDKDAPTSIRLNPFKPTEEFKNCEPILWCANGRYLNERPSFTFDPLFRAGTYYVQEASSMFLEQAYQTANPQNKAVKVLDMCAAPGGKSTHLLSLINEDSLLVSNEVIPNRNYTLQENITKWGVANSIVTQNKTVDFTRLPGYFDIVVVDAPCSGEGLFRKDKNAVEEWSEKNVAICSARQKEILQHGIACCREGGIIIYSTCTYEKTENDDSVQFCIDNGCETLPLANIPEGVIVTKYGYQFFPHLIRGEGFYLALLRKKETGGLSSSTISRKFKSSLNQLVLSEHYLKNSERFCVLERNEKFYAIPQNLLNDFQLLSSNLYIRQAGICLGTYKGKDFLPAHELSLSIYLRENIPSVELSYDEAIAYLRCDNIKLNTHHKGWAVARYKGFNLGWMKILDNRVNNYYPKEWRILKCLNPR